MTIPQSPLFQWCVCTFVLYVVFVSLYLEYRHRRCMPPEPPQREYNVVEQAEQVLYGYQQSEVDAE